ncbi:MAG: BrnA antitoxin family protein [Thermomicrobiales bacterium]
MSSDDIERLLDEYADALEQNASGALRDGDIDRSDHPEWTEAMFRDATRGTFYRPRAGEAMVPLDTEVIVWFRQRYPEEYQTAMNAALRAYMASHDEERDDLDPRKTA